MSAEGHPEESPLAVIAGRGAYPLLLAESARRQGVPRIVVMAFRGETPRRIERSADETVWLRVGELEALLEALRSSGVKRAVMAGQIAPRNLFRVRMDRRARELLQRLPAWNAHTIFGAVVEELRAAGIEVEPAARYMEAHLAGRGTLTRRAPGEREARDIELGWEAAGRIGELDIGQTVVVKDGTILAVEAFEGTNRTLRRAGRLGGRGAVMIKRAKPGHDMRFDIPVLGVRTIRVLRRIRAGAVALEAGRAIMLEKEKVCAEADRAGLAIVVR
ncbi:LpxI family protein [Kiritimatiella glycovorans]|uniref:DUF1009 domain-containing protein n=1 Tax=Kiritimatiella glycovorans TaxID=1307763 RepID=A0A0G3EG31_9BACT|nr:UDP-2,3-diacylglucosamine diphosphatase LpxI [Kiritimatiella glycovorans]AKJ65401.1 hypothetical protein L21SP4_02174 [Kiritimatiella glycovorans]